MNAPEDYRATLPLQRWRDDEEIPASDTLPVLKRRLARYASKVMAAKGNLIFVETADFDRQHPGLTITQATTPVKFAKQPIFIALKSRLTEREKMIDLITTEDNTPESLLEPLQRVASILPHAVWKSLRAPALTTSQVESLTAMVQVIDEQSTEPLRMIPNRQLPTFISARNNGREGIAELQAGQIIDLHNTEEASKYFMLKESEFAKYGS